MRSDAVQNKALKQKSECCFGPTEGRLSGSLADDTQRGFTLVELITIIVILGIISVVALPRFTGNDAFRDRATADQVAAALRYAQKVAIASHSNVTVNISGGRPTNCGTAVVAGVINCVVPDGVALGGTLSVTYDFMGRRVPDFATTVMVGTPSITITIAAETGYVH